MYAEFLQQSLSPRLEKLVREIELSLETPSMMIEASLREELLAAVPSLRAFAISLTGNRDRADDLVQETL